MSSNWPSPPTDPPRKSGPRKTRNGLWLLGLLIGAAALAIIFKSIRGGGDSLPIYIGSVLGIAVGYFVLAGIIPAIWWGVLRFEHRKAKGPLITWAILMGMLGLVSIQGARYENDPELFGYLYHPPDCEFSIRFPTTPEIYTVKGSYAGSVEEAEVVTKTSVLRASCTLVDTEILKNKGQLFYQLSLIAEQIGFEDAETNFSFENGVTKGGIRGSKVDGDVTHTYEVQWYVGDNSVLALTTGGYSQSYPEAEVVRFFDSVTPRFIAK